MLITGTSIAQLEEDCTMIGRTISSADIVICAGWIGDSVSVCRTIIYCKNDVHVIFFCKLTEKMGFKRLDSNLLGQFAEV